MNEVLRATLDRLEGVRADTLARFEPLTQEMLDRRPDKDETEGEAGWSLGEVLMHIAIDEIYVREMMSRPLREGIMPPESIRFLPPPPPYGLEKEAIRFWLTRARAETRRYIEEWPGDANTELSHEGGLRPMTSVGWLEGYAGHEAFHHQQIDRLT